MSGDLQQDPPVPASPNRRAPISSPGRRAASPAAPETVSAKPARDEASDRVPSPSAVSPQRRPPEIPRQPLSLVSTLAVSGSLLAFVALSPLQFGQLAFLAVAPWAWLVIDGRRLTLPAYGVIYLSGALLWLLLYLVEIDSASGGWLTTMPLVAYLGLYLPAFIWLGRLGRQKWRVAIYLWLPVVWCALEWLRSNLFGGFGLGLLAHAVVDTRQVLQITDLAGSYGLGALMVASGASVAELVWLSLRVRRLERHMPKEPDAEPISADSAAFTQSSRIGTGGYRLPDAEPVTRKPKARESLEEAVRRNRDRTRDYHLTMATLAVLVLAGVMFFSHWYGDQRVVQTRAWKLFESNQFVISPIGGPDSAERFREAMETREGGLLVTALDRREVVLPQRRPARSYLLIQPDTEGSLSAKLVLRSGKSQEIDLGRQRAERMVLSRLWRRPVEVSRAFATDLENLPIRLMPAVASSASIEQTVNDSLRAFPDRGALVDAIVLTIEPSPWDGSAWPRLTTRSVMAAAVANRCPVVAFVPDRFLAVATGDGNLWWSNAQGISRATGTETGSGRQIAGSLDVMAMIDPRTSRFVRYGELLPIACVCLCLVVLAMAGWRSLRARGTTPRFQPD